MTDKRLGKGLQALITSYSTENDRSMDGNVSIDDIIPNRNQPRQDFNQEQLDELTKSIASSGILQPLTVRESSEGKYELIAGERRLRAAKSIKLKTVPVYIMNVEDDDQMLKLALIENIQRQDLSSMEEAEALSLIHI